jgi:TRAP-type C4-dicarboxylate transport system permease small subunit
MGNTKENSLFDAIFNNYGKFSTVLSSVSAVCILLMILSTTIDTTARFLFNNPIPGMFELNEVLLVICVYMGISWTQIKRGHIRVEVFVLKFSARNRYFLNIFAWSVALFFVGILCYQSFYGFLDSYRIREFRWGSVQMPIWWAKGLVPLGCLMLMIQLVLDIISELKSIIGIKKDELKRSVVREF